MDELEQLCASLAVDGVFVALNRNTKSARAPWKARIDGTRFGRGEGGTAAEAVKSAVRFSEQNAVRLKRHQQITETQNPKENQ